VVLARLSSVGLLDGVGVRVAGDTQEVVQVLAQQWSFVVGVVVVGG
jgi:hypothetical protein